MGDIIALLGTGLMGHPMAKCLLSKGFKVQVWNRNFDKAQSLEEFGAKAYPSAHEAVQNADFVITMLPDGQIVEDVLFQASLIDALKPNAIIIDMSSIKPEQARAHGERLGQLGHGYLDAPASGGTKGAESGTLAIMVGGDEDHFKAAQHVFAPMGRAIRVGDNGVGQLSKLANQAIVGITIGAVSEAILLMQKGGADLSAFRAALAGGFADSIILQQHGKRMEDMNFEPGGRSRLQTKDLQNVLHEAQALNIELPMVSETTRRFENMMENHDGADLDHSALFLDLLDLNKQS